MRTDGTKIDTMGYITAAFDLAQYTSNKMPSVLKRRTIDNIDKDSPRLWSIMVNVCEMVLHKIYNIICLGPSCERLKYSIILIRTLIATCE